MLNGFPIRMLNGVSTLGLVATKKRNINLSDQYDKYFPTPEFSDPLLTSSGENEMTIDRFIPKMVREYGSDTERIAEVLKQNTIETTAKAIFDFVYGNIQYKLDNPHEEEIRRPARTWADRKEGVDCDCYATFISSILMNLGIPHYLRMAAYNNARGYQHIYIVVPKDANKAMVSRNDYLVIDPVLDRFNDEKPFIFKHDKKMQPVNALSVGLNGFPIRMLNGTPRLRSNLVGTQVYYSPELKTWALKGLDGGFYIQGDPRKRYVEPLNGVGVGWFGTALKIGKGIFNGVKKGIQIIKAGNNALKEVKNPTPAPAAEPIAVAKSAIAPAEMQEQGAPRMMIPLNNMAQQPQQPANQDFSVISTLDKILGGKITASNNATINSIMQLSKNDKTATENITKLLDDKIKSSNNATVTSLVNIDKGVKSELNKITEAMNSQIDTVLSENDSLKEQVAKVAELSKAALTNTVAINQANQAGTSEVISAVAEVAQKNEAQKNQQKYIMIAIAAVVIIVGIIYAAKPKNKTNY